MSAPAASLDALIDAFDAAIVAASAAGRAAELLAGTELAGPAGEALDAAVESEAALGWQLWCRTADDSYADFRHYGAAAAAITEETA